MEYEEESSEDNSQDYSGLLCDNNQDDDKYEIPASIEDEDYKGLELELMVFCRKHGKASERFVAFEGTSTGRRFLACAEPNALLKLWQMYEDAKDDRRSDNLQSALTIQTLTCDNKRLEAKYEVIAKDVESLFQAQDARAEEHLYLATEYNKEFGGQKAEIARKEGENQRLNQKYVILQNLSRAQAKVIQNLKWEHLKEKERLSEQRRNMQLHISHLQEVLAKSEAKITDEVARLKLELGVVTISNEKLTEELGVVTNSSWNLLLTETMN